MGLPAYILNQFPSEIQPPMKLLGEWIVENSVKKEDFTELKEIVKDLAESQKELAEAQKDLAEAQKRTEIKVEELAEEIKQTNISMREGFQKVNDQISTLGSRWGIKNENTIRNTISTLMEKAGYRVSRGHYGDREVDLVIQNGEHILLEITSSAVKKDIEKMNRSAEDYFLKHGIEPKLMLAAVYVSPSVMREITDSPRPIEIFSADEE